MDTDKIKIEVLADGTIKSTTDPISGANHSSATNFFKVLKDLAGGEVERHRRHDRHHHHGEEEHETVKA